LVVVGACLAILGHYYHSYLAFFSSLRHLVPYCDGFYGMFEKQKIKLFFFSYDCFAGWLVG